MLIQMQNNTGKKEKSAAIFFIMEEAKETISDFSKETVKLL